VHELIHLLGAVPIVSAPPGPPHACPDDAAHVCDSPNDIVLPGGCCASLAETALDIGRDDYYGHGCSW
jgi:hypothetical protein